MNLKSLCYTARQMVGTPSHWFWCMVHIGIHLTIKIISILEKFHSISSDSIHAKENSTLATLDICPGGFQHSLKEAKSMHQRKPQVTCSP